MPQTRDFDLILWGATGFTGQLTAEYLAGHAETRDLRWALGGRNRQKLEALRGRLAAHWPHLSELPVVVGDATSAEDMARVAGSTRVVASLVGPFARYGSELVAACVEQGTHYCDTTGEPQWVRRMIDRHHGRAGTTGARITHCCGFDSIPSDLGVYMVQSYAREHFGATCDRVTMHIRAEGATGLSGGTLHSMLNLGAELQRDPKLARLLIDPYSLNPKDARGSADTPDRVAPQYDDEHKVWTAPFLMAAINTRIVRRSNALLDHAYGAGLVYDERMPTGRGLRGLLTASAISAGMALATPAMMLGPVRRLLERHVLPKPGEGPSEAQRARARFELVLHGRTADGGLALRGVVSAEGDPGYGETAKMIGESALCLALDSLESAGGVLTPATAMGEPLIHRLQKAGHTYAVEVERASPNRLEEHTRRQQAQALTN